MILILLGSFFLAYPPVSSWWTLQEQEKIAFEYKDFVASMDTKTFLELTEEVRDYNQKLAVNPKRLKMSEFDKEKYLEMLDVDGTGVMGYVSIPKINIELPVFHGTGEEILGTSVGHMRGTSLPSAYPGAHCVIAAHRSRVSAKLFKDLDQLEVGDRFSFTVLQQTLTYEVDQVNVVKPKNLSKLGIESGQNYCTLMTCTPYGSEKYRLLVRGYLVAYSMKADVEYE